jgi:hypothetical protein
LKIVTCHFPANNWTSTTEKFLPGVKELFDKPLEEKKRRYKYVIYKRIDANYYCDNGDENDIWEKSERPT